MKLPAERVLGARRFGTGSAWVAYPAVRPKAECGFSEPRISIDIFGTEAFQVRDDPPPVRLLSLDETAAYLGVSYWTVRDLVQAGRLPTVRLPHPRSGRDSIRRILIDRKDVDQLIELSRMTADT